MDSEIFAEDLRRIDDLVKELNGRLSIKYSRDENHWRGSIKFDNIEYFFQINYISVYPLFPPPLFCFKDETYSEIWIDKLWTAHSYKDGHLCLFTNDSGESSWKKNYRLDEVLKKFLTLLQLTKEDRISPKHTSTSFNVRDYASIGEVYIRNDFFSALQTKNENIPCYYAIANESFLNPMVRLVELPLIAIFSANDPEFSLFPAKYGVLHRFFPESEYNLLKDALIEDSILKPQKFLEFCKENKIQTNRFNAFLLGNETDTTAPAFFLILYQNDINYKIDWFIINKDYSFVEAIFKRESDYLSESFKILENRKVLIIGLGTLGSKIAVELAKNGIKNLIIFDNDYYKPENVARGVAPFFFVGKPKVFVIEQMIKGISPLISVKSLGASPLNPLIKSKFIESLKQVDLVICAIDSELDEIEIQKLCVENNVPAIYSIALENGHYGRIYRVIPGKTPCTECIKRQIEENPKKYPALEANGYEEGTLNPYEHPGVPGINIFIWEIALKTVQFCLQTLARNSKLEEFFPDAPSDHFIISNKAGWIFKKPYQIKYFNFKLLEHCPICGRIEKKEDKVEKDIEIINKLINEYVI